MNRLEKKKMLRKYMCIHIDGSFSPYGGCVVCFKYSDGNHKIIKLSPQKDSYDTEYMALVEILKEINNNLTNKQKKNKIKIITDCKTLYREICGGITTYKPNIYKEAHDLINNLNINLIWKSRKENDAGKILERRINNLRRIRNRKEPLRDIGALKYFNQENSFKNIKEKNKAIEYILNNSLQHYNNCIYVAKPHPRQIL